MIPPAQLVLILAHVCLTISTASGPADHDVKVDPKTMVYHTRLKRWTNSHKNLDENNNEIYINNNDIDIISTKDKVIKEYDEIYVEDSEVGSKIENTKMDFMSNDVTNKIENEIIDNKPTKVKAIQEYDKIYAKDSDVGSKMNVKNMDFESKDISHEYENKINLKFKNEKPLRVFNKREIEDKCVLFNVIDNVIQHPHPIDKTNVSYYRNVSCVTVIEARSNEVIELMFIDHFEMEDHPDCAFDYLEIRDGKKGYSNLLGKYCGTTFPPLIQSTGPFIWLKFYSDDTIEYTGFNIHVSFKNKVGSSVPESCYIEEHNKMFGSLSIDSIDKCRKESKNLDVLWTITTPEDTKIFLNFTKFKLLAPNKCELNIVEVFGSKPETTSRLTEYCGSIANPVTTKDMKETGEPANIMNVRLYADASLIVNTTFQATYVAYRTLEKIDELCHSDEFYCEDNTCISYKLKCDGEVHCRLMADEDPEKCAPPGTSAIYETQTLSIMIVFILLLTVITIIFLYRGIKKLVDDNKAIKEQFRDSCVDQMGVFESTLTLDPKQLQMDWDLRASLDRDNLANEVHKRHRDSVSKGKASIDSISIQDNHLDKEGESRVREVESIPETEDVRIEINAKTNHDQKEKKHIKGEQESEKKRKRKTDMSKEIELNRSKREIEENERAEIREESLPTYDMKDSECQTRDSLFQTEPIRSSDGSRSTGTNSRGFSTYGHSDNIVAKPSPSATVARPSSSATVASASPSATVIRPSPFATAASVSPSTSVVSPSPSATNTSEVTIQLLGQTTRQDFVKPQKKTPDPRSIRTETTRSAPDVIILAKPNP